MNPAPPLSLSQRVLLLGALLAGTALRLFRLGAESLWYDETVSVFLAQKSVPRLIAHTAGDIHPPGYYLLLHLWQGLTRPTPEHGLEFLYAWVSVACGLVILALLWPIGLRLAGRGAALAGVWIAAVAPFHIWYAQEVRMYTLGAALGLLCLWALLQWFATRQKRWLVVYAFAAAAGLYTFYYFLFLLAALALCALLQARKARDLWPWLAANGAAGLLFAPWMGIFWQQATDPPVPPWRARWTSLGDAGASLSEALAAYLVGQTPVGPVWLWAALAAAALLLFATAGTGARRDRITLLTFMLVPTAAIFLVSAFATPLYHVRYLFAGAAPFALLLGSLVAALWQRKAWLGAALLAAIVAVSALSLHDFWVNPAYRADDHRGAVQALAQNWRPGDAILVNAGWVYPALEVYWPREPEAAPLPPPLAPPVRLGALQQSPDQSAVPVIVTGSVDGAASLGWGKPESDFFPLSRVETLAGLENLSTRFSRIWHFRLYDTVSDPDGVIRGWLEGKTATEQVIDIPGRDFGRVELRRTARPAPEPGVGFAPLAYEGDTLRLLDAQIPPAAAKGAWLYLPLLWEAQPGMSALGVGLSSSLRLVDGGGVTVAQQDGPLLPPTTEWHAGERVPTVLAVGVPAEFTGSLTVELVIYRQDDGTPLTTLDSRAVDGQRVRLGTVAVGGTGN